MANEYHLITPFGTGQTATMTIASPCVVTYTAHGLGDGTGVVFTTSGALPTGVVSGTTYYAKSTGANTFNLYDTKAHAIAGGATGQVNTSGSQSGTHTITGAYWYNLPTTDPGNGGNYKNRYSYASAFQVFKNFSAWAAALSGRANAKTVLTCEIQGKFSDSQGYIDLATGFYSILVTTKVNGVRDPDSFHGGKIGGGYQLTLTSVVTMNNIRSGFDGIETTASGAATYIKLYAANCFLKNSICKSDYGVQVSSNMCTIENNWFHDCATYGIFLYDYSAIGASVFSNTVTGCGTGYKVGAGNTAITAVGNVALGCTTANWGAAPSSGYFNYNAGINTDSPWASGGATTLTNIVSGDFAAYAVPADGTTNIAPSGDSGAHTSSSHLVDAGSQEFSTMISTDVLGNVRPSYKNGSATNWDIGCVEFDWGYGAAPSTVNLIINGIVAGSQVRIAKQADNSEIYNGSPGTSLNTTYTYTADVVVTITIRKAGYIEWTATATITSAGMNVTAGQAADGAY